MHRLRGAVLVESALVLTILLLVIYGAIELGIVGLEQLTVDGGAFTAAHQQSLLGNNPEHYMDAVALAKKTLPHLTSPDVSIPEPVFGEPPTFNDGSAMKALGAYHFGDANGRHGGVSLTLPVQTLSVVSHSGLPSLLLGGLTQLSVSGIAIDPAYRLINGHGDVSGSAFSSAAAFATASDPLVNGNNAPPYFVGFTYFQRCTASASPWVTCAHPFFAALGSAEYLDSNNWSRQSDGVVPSPQAVFWETRLHEDTFASIANALQQSQSDAQDTAILTPGSNPDLACIESFDNDSLGTYQFGHQIGSNPLYPAGNPACPIP